MSFGPDHLPYGLFAAQDGPRIGVAIGDEVLDCAAAARGSEFESLLGADRLNPLLAAGRPVWSWVRTAVRGWVESGRHRRPGNDLTLLLPFDVADYVDFYASEHHAATVGRIFRPDAAEPLPAAWKHLPIGYHGRAGTVVVSGTEIRRPHGQIGPGRFGPSERLDFEAEVGFVLGASTEFGEIVALENFRDHVFGVTLLNDWSARDIQAFEYVPLGPFLGKSFGTSVSPWITPLEALDQAWTAPPSRTQQPATYLDDTGRRDGLDLTLTVELNGTRLSSPPLREMYWTPAQLVAHLTVNGATVRAGDLLGSGTVSGPDDAGSLIELTGNGQHPVVLSDGSTRAYLADGDVVTIGATAPGAGGEPVTLGRVTGRIRAARRVPDVPE